MCPESGESRYWLVPEVNTPAFQAVLHAFAQSVGAGQQHQVVLVLDGAGWHVAKELVTPLGVTNVVLPPYSPELQRAEHLWALTDTPLFNQCPESLDQLTALLAPRCAWLEGQPDLISRHTLFHWWPLVRN